ncbi:MAG: hypothetical protein LBC80_00940 [Treponema sp.]|jgi:hypothetical protein|nr:hypothetical protein [Treponema sp.]
MAGKLLFFVLTLLFTALPVLHAQTDGFFIERRFVQRLSWSGDEYASRYELIIEKQEEGIFQRVHQMYTSAFQVDVSLSPGLYRYRVIPFDFLDRPGVGTAWIDFEVYTALNPELTSYEPELDLSDIDEPVFLEEYVLIIYGNYISPDAEFYIRIFGGTTIFPSDTQIYENRARLVFNKPYLIPELFEIIARNPGGLEASIITRVNIPLPPGYTYEDILSLYRDLDEGILRHLELSLIYTTLPSEDLFEETPRAPRIRKSDLYLNFAYTPLFPTFDIPDFPPDVTKTLSGFAVKFGFVNYANKKFLGWGLESALSFYSFDAVQLVTLDANLLFQTLVPSYKTALKFRFGAGVSYINNISFHYNAGISFLWLAGRSFYMETGADLVFWIYDEKEAGSLRPFIGIGWRF